MRTRIIFSFVLFIVFALHLSAQYPYRLSKGVEGPAILSGTVLYTTSFFLNRKAPSTTLEYLEKMDPLKPNFIDRLDRKILQRVDWKAHRTSNVFLYGSNAVLALAPLLAGERSRAKMPTTYFIFMEGLLVNGALTNMFKVLFKRPRPYAFSKVPPGMISERILLQKNTFRSFFSGHTSVVACNSFMAAKMLTDFYPESKAKPIIWTTATLLPAITGYLRVKAGKHFITDVLTGLAVGATVGWLIPELHR